MSRQEQNKLNAIAFYKTAYEGNPKEAVAHYVGNMTSSRSSTLAV